MPEVSSWLRGQRKYELVELAQEAGLRDYESLKKAELETALDEFLRANETTLSKHSMFNPFYTRRRPTASPVKLESVGSSTGAPAWEAETKPVRSRTRRMTRAANEVAQTDDSSPERALSKQLLSPRTPHTLQSVPLPPSPAAVADAIDTSTAELRSQVASAWESLGLTEKVEALRESLSSVVSIESAILLIEAFGLRSEVLPSRYAFTIPAIMGLSSTGWPVYLPDLFVCLSTSFWAPVSLWALTSLFVPLFFAYFFNLTLKAKRAHSGSHNQHAHQPTQMVDPLTFNIVKALTAYAVYSCRGRFGGIFTDDTVDTIQRTVPGGVEGFFIGSSIGVLTSIYDAILKK